MSLGKVGHELQGSGRSRNTPPAALPLVWGKKKKKSLGKMKLYLGENLAFIINSAFSSVKNCVLSVSFWIVFPLPCFLHSYIHPINCPSCSSPLSPQKSFILWPPHSRAGAILSRKCECENASTSNPCGTSARGENQRDCDCASARMGRNSKSTLQTTPKINK